MTLPPIIRDKNWLAYQRKQKCIVPSCERTECEAAHIRYGLGGGMAIKPSDARTVSLCWNHHQEMDRWAGGVADWWMRNIAIKTAEMKYQLWKGGLADLP